MPEILDRCVAHVMEQGHGEQSAYAICRSSLGLATDGSQDDMPMPDMPDDDEMKRRTLAFSNGPVLRKTIPLCKAVGPFDNGGEEGMLDLALFEQLVANQKKQPRQIPVYLITGTPNPDHPEDLDEMLADGWIEDFRIEGDWLIGDTTLHGRAAIAVASDMVRGASIGTAQGKTYAGDPMGQVLEHVVLSNKPFVKGMNIAASRVKGGEPVAYHFTALSTEAEMAEDKKKDAGAPGKDSGKPEDGGINLTEKVTALECLLQEKEGVIRELGAANANLLEEVKAFRSSPQLDLAMKEIDKLKRNNLAERVRRVTKSMLEDSQIVGDVLRGWFDHESDEVVLAGFKNSQFRGDLNLLQYHRDTVRKSPRGRTFVSGAPEEGRDMTVDEKKAVEQMGKDPEVFSKTRGAQNFTEWQRRKKAATKGA